MALKTYLGTEIDVNDKGRFSATIAGRAVSRTSLAAIEKIIREQRTRPIKAMTLQGYRDKQVVTFDVVGYDAHQKRFLRDGYGGGRQTIHNQDGLYLYDDEIHAELGAILAKIKADHAYLDMLLRKLKKVTVADLVAPEEDGA